MSEPAVMINEAHIIAAAKVMALATVAFFGAAYTAMNAVVGSSDGNTVAIGTTLGVSVTFAGLILRMVIKNQGAIWDIVKSKDDELKKKDAEIRQHKIDKEYLEWEREQARFRAKERANPGAFKLSPALMVPETDTTN